jgi:hypothetical protein
MRRLVVSPSVHRCAVSPRQQKSRSLKRADAHPRTAALLVGPSLDHGASAAPNVLFSSSVVPDRPRMAKHHIYNDLSKGGGRIKGRKIALCAQHGGILRIIYAAKKPQRTIDSRGRP